jgi:hypothetical protein
MLISITFWGFLLVQNNCIHCRKLQGIQKSAVVLHRKLRHSTLFFVEGKKEHYDEKAINLEMKIVFILWRYEKGTMNPI